MASLLDPQSLSTSLTSFIPGALPGVGTLFAGFNFLASYGKSELSGLLDSWYANTGGDAMDLYSYVSNGYVSKTGGEGYSKILGLTEGTYRANPSGGVTVVTTPVTSAATGFDIGTQTMLDVQDASGNISQVAYGDVIKRIWDPLQKLTGIGKTTDDYLSNILGGMYINPTAMTAEEAAKADTGNPTAETQLAAAELNAVPGQVNASWLPDWVQAVDTPEDRAGDTEFIKGLTDSQRAEYRKAMDLATGFTGSRGGGAFQNYLAGASDEIKTNADRVTEYFQSKWQAPTKASAEVVGAGAQEMQASASLFGRNATMLSDSENDAMYQGYQSRLVGAA